MFGIIGSVVMLGSVTTGVYFAESHYLTHATGVPRIAIEKNLVTKEELLAAKAETSDYLLDLRIENAQKQRSTLEESEKRRGLSSSEQRELESCIKELDRLYELREQRR